LRVQLKTCSKCKQELPVDLFYKGAANRDGLHAHCKGCCKDYKRAHRVQHLDVLIAKSRSYYQENRESILASYAAKYATSTERRAAVRAYNAKYYAKNSAKIAESKAIYYAANRARVLDTQAQYYRKHRVEAIARVDRWRKEQPAKFKALSRRLSRAWAAANPEKVKAMQKSYRENLSDSLVKRFLIKHLPFHVSPEDVPKILIDAKRQHLKAHRLIKEKQK
jgi:hypothetical protein